MPTTTTQTEKRRSRKAAQSRPLTVPSASGRRKRHSVLVKRNRTTHVIVPVDEYERLLIASEIRSIEADLEDPDARWVDAEVVARLIVVDRIIEAREKAGLTQKQLAERLKMPQSQVSRIERNPDRTTVRTLKKIAGALKVDVRSLL